MFLDEIGELPAETQIALLRVLRRNASLSSSEALVQSVRTFG